MNKVLNETIAAMTTPGQMFEIREAEVSGQKLKTWATAPGSLRDLWLTSATHGDADYLVYQNERLTYTQAHDKVARVGNWLAAQGIRQHDRVAIAMRNYPEWMMAYWAVVAIGAVPVGLNAWWVADEMKYGLADSGVKMLICDIERLTRFSKIRDDFPELTVVTVRVDDVPSWARPWSDLLTAEPSLPEVSIDPEDDACIFYTSGTTGQPKGARLTHRGCVSNLFSVLFSNMSQMTAQAITLGTPPPDLSAPGQPKPAAIVATPLFHVTANNSMAHVLTASGGKLVHMYKWDAGEALRIIEEERITNFTGVPIMSRELINHPDYANSDTSSLAVLGGGGAAVQPDLIKKIENAGNGAEPAQGYGLTEVCGVAAGSYGVFLRNKPNSAGRVIPVFDVKCIDAEGKELPPGEPGEICLRGPQVIKGYLNRPEASAETIVDGWLRTGDIGFVDEENFIYLVDRVKDMVLRGGEIIYSSEVEVALFKHPNVSECAVFAVPDERLGEEVGAAVFPKPGTGLTAEALREFCKTKLAAFKVPRFIWIMHEPLPRNASGKFVKRELQAALQLVDAL